MDMAEEKDKNNLVGEVNTVLNLYKRFGRSPREARVGLLSGSAIRPRCRTARMALRAGSGGNALWRTTPVRLTRGQRLLSAVLCFID